MKVAAQKTLSGSDCEKAVSDYIDTIVANIGTKDWGLRYFAAVAYIELYDQTTPPGIVSEENVVTIKFVVEKANIVGIKFTPVLD